MNKVKRIFAMIGAVLLTLMYVATLILSLISSPWAQTALMAAITCTVFIPVLLYAILLVARVLDNRKTASEETEHPQKK